MASGFTSTCIRRALVLLSASFLGLAMPAQAEDLLDVYRHALVDDRRLAAARAQLTATTDRLDESRAAWLPHVALRATASLNDESYRPPQMHRNYNANGYVVVLTQTLFRRQSDIEYSQAESAIAAARLQFETARQTLILRVAQAYFDVLLARDVQRSCSALHKAVSAQRSKVETLLREGAATRPDVEEAMAQDDSANAQWVAARSHVLIRMEALRQLAGPLLTVPPGLRDDVGFEPPSPDDIEAWSNAASDGNYEVQAAEAAVQMAAKELERQRAAALPTLELVGGRGRFSQSGGVIFGLPIAANTINQTSIGLQLTVPLYTGGGIDSRSRQATALRDKAADLLEDGRRTASLEARSIYLAVVNGIDRVRANAKSLSSSRSALESNQAAFTVGKRLSSDVLVAQHHVAAAEQALAQSRFDVLMAQLRLKASTGSLDETELDRINGLLDLQPAGR